MRQRVLTHASIPFLLLAVAISGCSLSTAPETAPEAVAQPTGSTAKPVEQATGAPVTKAATPGVVRAVAMPAVERVREARWVDRTPGEPSRYLEVEPMKPAGPGPRPRAMAYEGPSPGLGVVEKATTPALDDSWDSTNFDDNGDNTGFVFIPPDPIAAAGTDDVVTVVNTTVRFHDKDGTLLFNDALGGATGFFMPLTPLTNTFDPKVIYDQYEDRFVIVTLERTAISSGDPADTSRIFMAVSDDGDPTGTWCQFDIDAVTDIGGSDHWADYPGLAVDEEAVYVANNMFSFAAGAGGGSRLWIIDKGTTGGFYDCPGGTPSFSVFDPYTCMDCIATTTQPAHVFGTAPAGVGTLLVSYSGLTDFGTLEEFFQIVQVDDPLTSPTFSQQFVGLGSIEDLPGSFPPLLDAPQSGSASLIETNDRRALDAVWRDGSLYVATTILPESGPDAGNTAAHWVQLDTSTLATITVDDQGSIDGEDIATDTLTFFPAIAVNAFGDVAIGFSASAPSIFAGAYYTTRTAIDPAGTTNGSEVLRAGLDVYLRTFGAGSNRWGDYSGMEVDPTNECFWAYNEYAMTAGSGTPPEDGRWATAAGTFCVPLFADGFESGDTSAW
ncbi:MAG: hypothetical protein GY719_08830 [bacterium]|nr:hypothetical protein [bacterium]